MKKITIVLAIVLSLVSVLANAHYAILIDAGSSGSRLHLFQYEHTRPLPMIKDVFSESITPGLSSFVTHAQDAGPSLKTMLDDALVQLQKKNTDPSQVSVSVLGTAGMRLLTEAEQRAIYADVTSYIKNYYPFPINDVKTISGKMEGVYGWLDVNYLLNNFNSGKDVTRGIIDMGGASTELVFTTNDIANSDDLIKLNIDGKQYNLFSKSFLGLGQDEARVAINQDEKYNTCYPVNYTLAGKDNSKGDFNFVTCAALYQNMLDSKNISQQIIPLANKNFIAYSGVYYDYHFFGVDTTPSRISLEEKLQQVCTHSWEQMQQQYPDVPTKYLSVYCANSIYVDRLLYTSYALQDQQLIVLNKINHQVIDWTLGALFYRLAVTQQG